MNRFAPKAMTREQGTAQMRMFLYGCAPSILATVTADNLCARHNVTPKVAEYELIIARQKRAGEK